MDIQKLFVSLVPGMTLATAHWFPWRKWLQRDLHRLEAYAIGVTAIVGAAMSALFGESEISGKRAAGLVGLSALSGGLATLLAWAVDKVLYLQCQLRFQADMEEAMNELRPQSDQGVDR